jgi:hypothetical protein
MTRDELRSAFRAGESVEINGTKLRVAEWADEGSSGFELLVNENRDHDVECFESKGDAVKRALALYRELRDAEPVEQTDERSDAYRVYDSRGEHFADAETLDGAKLAADTLRDEHKRTFVVVDGTADESVMLHDDNVAYRTLPVVPTDAPGSQSVSEAARERKRSGLSRVSEGRRRSNATRAKYALSFDPFERYAEQSAELHELKIAAERLDEAIDAENAMRGTPERTRELYDVLSGAAYDAWVAGVPTTVIGGIVGCSAGSARGRALRYAEQNDKPAPEPLRRSSRDRTPQNPVSVSARFVVVLTPLYNAALSGDIATRDAEIVRAFEHGVGVSAIGRVAGVTTSTARRIAHDALAAAGKPIPSNEQRREQRASAELPELPDD